MEDIQNVYFSNLVESPYVKPFRLHYTQGGRDKSWDLMEVHDSVVVLCFNVNKKVVIFVKQFRPAIYFNSIHPDDRFQEVDTVKYPASLGISLEMCGGLVNKDAPLAEIARDELFEETGYDVPVTEMNEITSYRLGVGVVGSIQTLFYCEVTNEMKTGPGGGTGDEIIELAEMSIPQVDRYLASAVEVPLRSPPTCLYPLMWFIHNKADRYRNGNISQTNKDILTAIVFLEFRKNLH